MDSFEFTKIAGAVLAPLLVIVGFKTYLDVRLGEHGEGAEHKSEVGYTLPSVAPAAPAAPAAKDAGDTKTAAATPAAKPADAAKPAGEMKATDAAKPAADSKPAAPAPAATAASPAAPAPAPATAEGYDAAKIVGMIASAKAENGQGIFKKCLTCHSAEKAAASKVGPNLWNVVGRKKGTREDYSGYSEAMKGKGGEWTLQDLAGFVHAPKAWLPGTKMLFAGVSDPADVADLLAYIRTLADSPAPLPN